ncbi:MAG: DUF3459 domain-containing protein [Ruminococcaceae bacterium]|nr:DUF3459 domain-containing protein [Oscillospiraceae bacterium]
MPPLFNSRDSAYRAPFGAVPVGTAVLLRLRLPREWGCHAATLTVERDGCPPEQQGMFWAGMAGDGHEWWDIHYTPAEPAVYYYAFRLETRTGTVPLSRRPDGTAATGDGCRWQLTAYRADFRTPDWLAGGIMYQIFPDRFACSGCPKEGIPTDRVMHPRWEEAPAWEPDAQGRVCNNDYFGGDLRGITQKLDYLASLGVTCLYLNPIFEAHSNHRYDTADYTRVDPLLGTEQDLTDLLTAARDRGIRVLLDGVFSHTGADSVYFNRDGRYPPEGAYNTPASPYADWYRFKNWPRDYACWWGFVTLPEVEETAPGFMEHINGEQGVVATRLRQGAGGWRLDVADELPDGFLEALRRRAKATDPEALVLGEVWEDASHKESYGHRRRYLLGDQLDSVMNYPFREAIWRFLLEGNARDFTDRVMTIAENYPAPVLRLLMNHIGTHDTERALTLLGGEPANNRDRRWQAAQKLTPEQRARGLARLRLATLLQYALPGVPCIYYGDEAGLEGYRDPFNRGTYPWGREDTDLVDWYRRLGQCRRQCPALAEGAITPLMADQDVVCFAREGERRLFCAVNRGDKPQELTLPHPGRILVGDGHVTGTTLTLPPLSGAWLEEA